MFETLKNAFKVKEIRKKIFITLLILLVYRIGCYIPIPGITASTFSDVIDGNTFLELMNGITGGSLANGTLFALGIGPYINASIIMQLLCVGIPALERLSKQGEEGKKKISQITRFVTLLLAVIQSVGIILAFGSSALTPEYFLGQDWLLWIFMIVVYSAGAMLTMWLGERITEYGVGNGISLLIFVGIISTAADTLIRTFISAFTGNEFTFTPILQIIIFIVLAVILFALIVTGRPLRAPHSRAVRKAGQGQEDVRRAIHRHTHQDLRQRRHAPHLRVRDPEPARSHHGSVLRGFDGV